MLKKMLLAAPAVLIIGSIQAQPLPDYSRDTIRVTAEWSHVSGTINHQAYEARAVRTNAIISASPVAQMAVVPAAIMTPAPAQPVFVEMASSTLTPKPVVAPEIEEADAEEVTNKAVETAATGSLLDQLPGVSNVLGYARRLLSSRYRSGGESPSGFDCSGFVRYCFNKLGVNLPHSSAAQASVGARVDREFAQPGDLIFFNGHAAGGRVGHVGIITEVANNQIKFIHSASSGGVRYDNANADYYRKRFVTIRRVAHMVANK